MFRLAFLLLLMPVLQAQTNVFQQLHDSYESFFVSRYSLEQEFPFRLISVRAELIPYQAQMDIRHPILSRLQLVDVDQFRATLFKSFMPIMYNIVTGNGHDPLTTTKQFIGRAGRAIVADNHHRWQKYLQASGQQRVTYRLLLAPYRKTDARLFYDRQKISMVRNGNLAEGSLLWDEGQVDVQRHVSKEIDLLRAFLYYQHKQTSNRQTPRFLGAILTVDIESKAVVLTGEVLVHLYPQQWPYEKSKDGLTFSQIKIPQGAKYRFPTARLRIRIVVDDDQQQPPLLAIDFGNFSRIKDFSFVLNEQHNLDYNPHLIGKVDNFKALEVKFQFQKVLLSLNSLQAEEVKMVFSPAFKVGSLLNARLGNFQLSKIDRQFRTEINQQLRQHLDQPTDQQLTKLFNDQRTAKFVSDSLVMAVKQLLSAQPRL